MSDNSASGRTGDSGSDPRFPDGTPDSFRRAAREGGEGPIIVKGRDLDRGALGLVHAVPVLDRAFAVGIVTAACVSRFVYRSAASRGNASRLLRTLREAGYLARQRSPAPYGSGHPARPVDAHFLPAGEPVSTAGRRYSLTPAKARDAYDRSYDEREIKHLLLLAGFFGEVDEGLFGTFGAAPGVLRDDESTTAGEPEDPDESFQAEMIGESLVGSLPQRLSGGVALGEPGENLQPDGLVRLYYGAGETGSLTEPVSCDLVEAHTGTQQHAKDITDKIERYLKLLDALSSSGLRPSGASAPPVEGGSAGEAFSTPRRIAGSGLYTNDPLPRVIFVATDERRALFVSRYAAEVARRSPLYTNLSEAFAKRGIDLSRHILVTSMQRIARDPDRAAGPVYEPVSAALATHAPTARRQRREQPPLWLDFSGSEH